jgi:competence/damage-inducible protein CinA-like protein
MPSAEIITIGTEILLGEIIDTNSRYIARRLRSHGIDIFRVTSIGDNPGRIAAEIRSALARADIVITTGGLGPTVDDPTREAVAAALEVPVEFREDLWQQVIDRFARFDRYPTENNRRQAYVPQGALGIENPVGTAPAFMIERDNRLIFSLPGVPREMEHLLEHAVIPELQEQFDLDSVLVVRLLRTSGAGESQIDEKIADLERLDNPTVGLAAHSGQVDVRIAAKAATIEAAHQLIAPVEADLRARLGTWIFGTEADTLAAVALENIAQHGWSLAVLEAGLGGQMLVELAGNDGPYKGGRLVPVPPHDPNGLKALTRAALTDFGVQAALGIALYPAEKSVIYLALITPEEEKFLRVPYGGPQKLAPLRAANLGLDLLRKC